VVAIIRFTGPTEMPSEHWPVGAGGLYVKTHREVSATRNMFNQYTWGGYLMEVLPEHKVFVDGPRILWRTMIREFDDTAALRTNWPGRSGKISRGLDVDAERITG